MTHQAQKISIGRRTLLAGLAAAPLIPVSVPASAGSEADLLQLGAQLRAAVAEWAALEPACMAASQAQHTVLNHL